MTAIIVTLIFFITLNVLAYYKARHVFWFSKQAESFLLDTLDKLNNVHTDDPEFKRQRNELEMEDIVGLQEFLEHRNQFVWVPISAMALNGVMLLYPISPFLQSTIVGSIMVALLILLNADSIMLYRNLIRAKHRINFRCELYNQLLLSMEDGDNNYGS